MINIKTSKGKVIIAGAGPGDPELITLKAFNAIAQADVIIVDRLVSEELLQYAGKNAKIIFAGKQGHNDRSVPQTTINQMIVTHATEGKLVLRLKGGDVSIFSNLLDELETLAAHHIPYEIIPGITAASGAAAFAGIPLTARGHATAVRFLTCYDPTMIQTVAWKELASTSDTLVFYMSSSVLGHIIGQLLDNGISPDKYIAVVEQATTPSQHVEIFNPYEYESRASALAAGSPALIIIGTVARLHQNFHWLPEGSRDEYFKPLKTNYRMSFPFVTH